MKLSGLKLFLTVTALMLIMTTNSHGATAVQFDGVDGEANVKVEGTRGESISTVPETDVKTPRTKPVPPPASPTKPSAKESTRVKVPTRAPVKSLRKVSPGLAIPERTKPVSTPVLNTMIKPRTVAVAPEAPILEAITFHGHDSNGNLIWRVRVNNNKPTTFSLPLWVSGSQGRMTAQTMDWNFTGNIPVTPSPLAAGQQTEVTGSFARLAGMTHLRLRLKSGATSFQELDSLLPPDLTYQARIVSINLTANTANPFQVRVQNSGSTAIPDLSVQKLCAHSSSPNSFTACGGQSHSNILPGQIVDSNHPLPLGWPTNPNIMKVVVRRGLTDYDMEMYYPAP